MNKEMVWFTILGVGLRMLIRTSAVICTAIAVGQQYGTNFGYMVFGVGILFVWR